MEKFCKTGEATDVNVRITRRMGFSSRIIKSTGIQSQYVILIAFPLQQRSVEHALILRYMYIVQVVRLNVAHCVRLLTINFKYYVIVSTACSHLSFY